MNRIALAEVCEIKMGQAPPGESYNDVGEGIPLIAGAGDFAGGVLRPKKFTTGPTQLSQAGDVILGIRATIGTKVWADGTYCLGRGVAGLRPKAALDRRYLWHWLSSAQPDLERKGRGATFLQVNRADIAELQLPLPLIEEQRRVAAILDHADELRAKRQASLALLDSLNESIFLGMFGDPGVNASDYPLKTLDSLGQVITGNTPSRVKASYYGDYIEWIKSDNIRPPLVWLTRSTEGLSEAGARVGRLAPAGSLLVTCIAGTPASIGNVALADRPVAFNQQINAVVPAEADSRYLHMLLTVAQPIVQRASTASMKGMISKSRFERIELPVAPLQLQREFSALVGITDRCRELIVTAAEGTDELFSSLQQRAFTGQL